MQHINDDIDELMRNAAENYPLKTNSADWDTVARLLAKTDGKDNLPPIVVLKPAKNNNRYRYLLLLLLIPAAFMAGRYTGLFGGGSSNSSKISKAAAGENDNSSTATKDNVLVPKNAEATAGDKSTGAGPQVGSGAGDQNAKAALSAGQTGTAKMSINQTSGLIAAAPDESAKTGPLKLSDLRVLEHQSATVNVVAPVNTAKAITSNGKENDEVLVNTPNSTQTLPNSGNAAGTPAGITVQNSGTTAETPAPAAKNDGSEMVKIKKPKRFYAGVMVAPDYTTVKYQPNSKVGFDFGGLVGYSLTKNLDVELGISVDKKYYESKGQYFDSKLKWIDGSNMGKLLSINGYCNLTEIPFSLKYNFKRVADGNFFVAAGVVSDVVHEENYDYRFDKNGYIYEKDRSTKIGTTTMFSNVTLSGGYESSLGGLCNFRIEPYYRLPIRGIGLGNLPITSFGLNIGITKKIK